MAHLGLSLSLLYVLLVLGLHQWPPRWLVAARAGEFARLVRNSTFTGEPRVGNLKHRRVHPPSMERVLGGEELPTKNQ